MENKEEPLETYDFGLDVVQKITFFIMMLIAVKLIKVPGIATAAILMITIFSRVLLFAPMQVLINKLFGKKQYAHPFLLIPHKIWVAIVTISVVVISIIDTINQRAFFVIPCVLVVDIVAILLFTRDAKVTCDPEGTDPNKRGTHMWKKTNGVEYVMNNEAGQRIYRDKNGNYYCGSGYVPIPPPVTIIKKK